MSESRYLLLAASLLIAACGETRSVREGDLPSSHRNAALSEYRPPETLRHIAEWYPQDWRVHLLLGLTDTSRAGRLASLALADSLRPDDPLPAYYLALAYLEGETPEEERRAGPHIEKALALDSANGVLRVMRAYVLLREGRVAQARALFLDSRRIPGGDFYYPRLEEVVLGLFSRSRQLNPYTLTEAAAMYRSVPLPPFEKMIDILYSVFLSPLEDHPYDIRLRGREAAQGIFQLGRKLRVGSYSGPEVLSGGFEQRALGFMFQLKAAEFLTLFHRAFDDSAGSRDSFEDLVEVQKEYEAFMGSASFQDTSVTAYLDGWSALFRDQPRLTVGEACRQASSWPLWKKTLAFRYPARDDRP
jgi:hypothetical protein